MTNKTTFSIFSNLVEDQSFIHQEPDILGITSIYNNINKRLVLP